MYLWSLKFRMHQDKTAYIYILTNKHNTTFYIAVTLNLQKRIYEHKMKLVSGFSKRYELNKLVYYEQFGTLLDARARERQLKNWHREWKVNLIRKDNPDFCDLADSWYECDDSVG